MIVYTFSSLVVLLSIATLLVSGEKYTADTYPNPTKPENSAECNMRSVSQVCDPDQVLSESSRYRLNAALHKMIHRTEKVHGNECDRRGFEPLLLIAQEGSQALADEINTLWNLDGHCTKSVIFFLSSLEHQLYYSSESGTGFDQADFIAVRTGQEHYMAESNYTYALANIFKQIGGAQNIQLADDETVEHYHETTTKKSAVVNAASTFGSARTWPAAVGFAGIIALVQSSLFLLIR